MCNCFVGHKLLKSFGPERPLARALEVESESKSESKSPNISLVNVHLTFRVYLFLFFSEGWFAGFAHPAALGAH